MTTLLWILAALALAVIVILIVAAMRPRNFRLERSTIINAPSAEVLALIDDFHAWKLWSPFENMDADLTRRYEGASRGPGAIYEWQGKKSGSGRMEVLQSTASNVRIKLDFLKPFEAHNTADFSAVEAAGSTQVSWAMYGPQSYLGRLMTMFFSMDQMVGGEFEKGLAKLKSVAEASA